MFRMSFYDGTLDKTKAKQIVTDTDKEIRYTYGLAYRHPRIYKQLITKEKALEIIDNEGL